VATTALNGSGRATYITSTLPVATHSITATYGGSGNYNASTSGALTQIVNRAASTTTITSDLPDPSVVGETFPVTVTVSGVAGVAPTGLFTVTVAGGPWTCNALLANGTGRCNLTITTTTGSPRTLTANYGGDLNYNVSSDTETHSVNPANTTTTITSAIPPQPTLGQTITVNYTVTVPLPGAGVPTGNVIVSAGSDSCTGTVAAGSCQVTFTTPTGSRTLTAAYQGDSNFNSSTSSGIPINIVRPSVQFSSPTYSVQEDTGGGSPAAVSAIITATLSNPSIYTVTVSYATSNGSAVAGTDYQTAGGTLTFNPGQTQRTFTVTTIPDGLAEGDETVALTLSNPNNRANLGAQSTSTLFIVDNEGPPTLYLTPSARSVNEPDGSFSVNVTLSTPAQSTVTVTVSSVNGTATAGQDFVAANQVLAFAPSETLRTFNVTLLNDNIYELDEVFTLTLSNATNALISSFQQTQTVTIQSEEAPPSVQFSSATYAFAENGGSAALTVTLSRPSALTAQVSYATSNGTALAGADYQSASGTLTFAPLDTSETILVPLTDDGVAEDYKNLFLTLSNPSVATPSGTGMNATVTIANDDARAGCANFTSSDVPKIIPDNTPAGITSTITLPGPGFVITDVSVRINSLQHVFLGDLQISLVAPDGRSVVLLNNVGDKPNLLYTVFNDSGANIVGNHPPFTGVFRPNTSLPALSRLDGSLSGGVWGLRIVDDRFPDSDLEQLNSWGLELCGSTTMTHVVYLPLVRR
jgi:subtilisin-like proprotein convertase family protein